MKKKAPDTDLDQIIPLLLTAWRKLHKEPGPQNCLQTREFRKVVSMIEHLQDPSVLQSKFGNDYFVNDDILGAYLLYHWVIHYQQGLSVINELPTVPRRVLDVCSGPAPLSFAALKHGANDVYAIDQNLKALQLGAEVCGKYGFPMTIRRWSCFKSPIPVEGHFDLIILSHCLEELFPSIGLDWEKQQTAFIENLLERLSPGGYLLFLESSLLGSNRRLLKIRDHFYKKGTPIQAPCIWKGECPALRTKDSPCYAQRTLEKPFLIKEFQRAANINLSSLKMSYLILRHPSASWPRLPDKELFRIISPPVETQQGKRYYLCGTSGKKTIGLRGPDLPKEARAFEYFKRGELISIQDALETPNTIEIVKGTKVNVEAACGKPIPEINQEEKE